ncbi:hypothetical protein [Actinokineospora sp. NBRC 105648]|uniref:hypothetical protein n=1 Tax=Actinokineospora sp. NBRC 105648 TaxID=3032206 RepID=UPI0025543CDD|nr:hypothetical protein [Actinokineospora sp. NBRC 105648]
MNTVLAAVLDHLDVHPELDAVTVTVHGYGDLDVVIQCDGGSVAWVARVLLAWAATLEGVSAIAWRPPHGESVHLDVTGVLPSGASVRVYTGVRFDPTRFPDLEPRGRQSLGLTVLRAWAVDEQAVAA